MILTDREIKISIEKELIKIDPLPGSAAYSSTSVDLTLSATIRTFKETCSGVDVTVDPGVSDYKSLAAIGQLTEALEIPDGGWVLSPRKLILAWTREIVDLRHHARIAARVEGKSSLARVGLAVHVTAPTIHSGFKGSIQLEVINHGPAPIRLRPGMSICQLIFEQTLGAAEKAYQGQFLGQAAS